MWSRPWWQYMSDVTFGLIQVFLFTLSRRTQSHSSEETFIDLLVWICVFRLENSDSLQLWANFLCQHEVHLVTQLQLQIPTTPSPLPPAVHSPAAPVLELTTYPSTSSAKISITASVKWAFSTWFPDGDNGKVTFHSLFNAASNMPKFWIISP